MVSDTGGLSTPSAQATDPASAPAMDGNPVLSPRSSVDGAAGVLVDGPLFAEPQQLVAPATPPPSVPSAVLQTVDIRRQVPVVLDLLAGNYSQWRRHFDTAIGMFGLRDHIDAAAVPRPNEHAWQMADHTVVHWLYATISPELLDAVMQPEDTTLAVWLAVDELFRNNQLARAVYIDAEYHAVVQGDLTVMQYCTKLKTFVDQLRDLGQPVTESRQVFHLLRGLNRQFHSVVPHITCQDPLPSFLQVRSFLLLEEHRAAQATRQQSTLALFAGRGSSSTTAPPSPPSAADNPRGRGRGRGQRRRGQGNGSPSAPPAPLAPCPFGYPAPAPGANSWTGLVQAWPMPWRAPGTGVLGPRPGTPHQQAMFAAPAPYGYGAPGAPPASYGAPGGLPPTYGSPGASSSTAPPPQPWDMHSLQAALHSATFGPSSCGAPADWYLDSGASSHMSNSPGPSNQGGDSPM
ncbi:uncharacterized protein LOC123400991 [Hordeum vulgare subsp. vulgare]|uniref:uncharacterized protein LOC123400991 n=1 Tax=Hordeum vulgare subsp. vulgare TaxID=112509 RepID=UPI001D1A4963|nr:uncharacterized protein LOC123400991 [Hordeum vulgare subsp. vulgare]